MSHTHYEEFEKVSLHMHTPCSCEYIHSWSVINVNVCVININVTANRLDQQLALNPQGLDQKCFLHDLLVERKLFC